MNLSSWVNVAGIFRINGRISIIASANGAHIHFSAHGSLREYLGCALLHAEEAGLGLHVDQITIDALAVKRRKR